MIEEVKTKCPLCEAELTARLFILPDSPRGNFQEPWYCTVCDLFFSRPAEVMDWCRAFLGLALRVQTWSGPIKWVAQYEIARTRHRGVKRPVTI